MSDEHESSSKHPAQRHKSGEYDPIYEILRSQQKMQGEINEIKERLAGGDHAISSVKVLNDQSLIQRDRLTVIETQMSVLKWIAGVAGTVSIGAIVTAFAALILKGHP